MPRIPSPAAPLLAAAPHRLADRPTDLHAAARAFCLDTIQEVYGTPYRADWHADLDSLCLHGPGNHYASGQRGAFWAVLDGTGAVLATAGLSHLGWKPALSALFPARYPAGGHATGFLGRVYVRQDHRGQGLGRHLVALAEAEAARLRFPTLYLHAAADAPATLAFWRAAGFHPFATHAGTAHFDKPVGTSRGLTPR